jgi:Asp-tRNA(Asn)/Glu-tRNA(Gln) amidotransferase C subunit
MAKKPENVDFDQLVTDFDRIIELFSKMEKASMEDVDSLKKESTLLQKELRDRYEETDSTETNSPEA